MMADFFHRAVNAALRQDLQIIRLGDPRCFRLLLKDVQHYSVTNYIYLRERRGALRKPYAVCRSMVISAGELSHRDGPPELFRTIDEALAHAKALLQAQDAVDRLSGAVLPIHYEGEWDRIVVQQHQNIAGSGAPPRNNLVINHLVKP